MSTTSTALLTAEDVAQYREIGYVVKPAVFDESDREPVEAAIRELVQSAQESGSLESVMELEPEPVEGELVPRRIYNPFHQHQAFNELARDPRLLDSVEQLIGDSILLQHSKMNMKPARVGSVVEWHQDLTYFPHTNDDLVTTLIYLDDATGENGCLQVLPRRHRGYLEHELPDGTFAGMVTEDVSRLGEPVPLPAPAGSVIFMHCLTPHSSLPNRSVHARRTLIYEYRAGDAFPIALDAATSKAPPDPVVLRGEVPQFGRFGSIPPYIPRLPRAVKSLYELQAESKAAREER